LTKKLKKMAACSGHFFETILNLLPIKTDQSTAASQLNSCEKMCAESAKPQEKLISFASGRHQ